MAERMKNELRELRAKWKKNNAVQKHMLASAGPTRLESAGEATASSTEGSKKKTGKGNELGRKVMSSSRRGRGPHMLI